MSKPERNYAVGLIVLAFVLLLNTGQFLLMIWRPWTPELANFPGVFWFTAFILAAYCAMTVAALWIYFSRPEWAGIALMAVNIMLCAYFPIGTGYAIYYFRKVRPYVDASDNRPSAPATVS